MPLRLKSLELHGYKTFASRTLFVYAGTVTAIVGPNGSGKSNIADSLRWVLGEQSYALLRGKKTEDMIFSGSESRPRAGMASATITFDNCDGWLPIDFSEVAITRRASRDGQNEYLINGQRVRLKDVSELLAQSGLAERTYTIIGQGLVDAALALKAEERRRLFEEAAGIGLHRTRREEALRRLEATRRNLERVQDILAELQPRLRSLERQARRAQEYEQVKADLQVMLREWYGYHWRRAQQELAEAREGARAQESVLERARQDQASLDEKLGALRQRTQGLRASLNGWHRESAQLHTRREAVSRELAVGDERARSFQQQMQASRAELARVQQEAELHQERKAEAGREAARLESELADARKQADSARQTLSARQAERSRAERELQGARQTLAGLNARQGQLHARLSERRSQAERSRKTLEEAVRSAEKAAQEATAAEARLKTAEQGLEAARAASKEAEGAYAAAQKRVGETETARRSLIEERARQQAEMAGLKARLEVLTQAENAMSGYAAGTRLLLQAARQERLSGVRGALSSHLEVPAEYETAIAAALGEYLDAVMLEDGNAEHALDLLAGEARRGVLLPLESLRASGRPACGGEGILGIAADLVAAPEEMRPAVELLLGQVIVATDRAAARGALAGQPSGVRAVTLSGEVFLASGPVLAGAAGRQEDGAAGKSGEAKGKQASSDAQTLLGRQRQRRELADALARMEQQVADLSARLSGLEEEYRARQAEAERLSQAQRQARQQEERSNMAASQAALAVEQATRQARWQQEQRQRIEEDIRRGEKEAASLSDQLSKVDAEIAEARERVRSQNAALAALSLDEYQSEAAHWSTLAAVAERALADGRARLAERGQAVEQTLRAQAAFEARLGELDTSLIALEREKTGQRQAEGEIGEQIEALRVLIDPAEAELAAVEREQVTQETAEAAARQALSFAEHNHAQARINLARRQEALDALRTRIEDDFGLVAFEYAEDVSGPTPLPLQGMVEKLPRVTKLSPEIEENIKRQRAQLRRMGAINPEAQAEYQEVKERFTFLKEQVADLEKAEVDVHQVIAELDALMQREFRKTFDAVAEEFKMIFTRLFGGGAAHLVLTDPGDLTNTGIDIEARLPGRRTQGLSLLSGGERSLTAVALVFALLKVSPTPFCVLDEVDAMLDEANVGRFRDLLRELSQNTQFVVVTHNRNTVQVADVIYGITMGRDSASQVISLRLDEVSKVVD